MKTQVALSLGSRVRNSNDSELIGTIVSGRKTFIDSRGVVHTNFEVKWDEKLTVNGRITTESYESPNNLETI